MASQAQLIWTLAVFANHAKRLTQNIRLNRNKLPMMVALTKLGLAISAISGAFAAPAADAAADSPDFFLEGNNLARRQDYNQNYKTGGNVNFSPTSNGYSVTFSGAGDFVVGKGWNTGTNR